MDIRNYLQVMKCILCWSCCSALDKDKEDILGHFLLSLAMTASILVFSLPSMSVVAQSFPCCRKNETEIYEECNDGAGVVVGIRLGIVYVTFFVVSSILDVAARRREDCLEFPKRRMWFSDVILISCGCYVVLHISPSSFDMIAVICLSLGGILFIVIEFYTVVRISYFVIITLHVKAEGGSKMAEVCEMALFIFSAACSVSGGVILIYVYPFCSINIVFILLDTIVPFVACIWSSSDCVKMRNSYSTFIQGSFLSCFVTFYTWLALYYNKSADCKSSFDNLPFFIVFLRILVLFALCVYLVNGWFSYRIYLDELLPVSSSEDAEQGDLVGSGNLENAKVRVYNLTRCYVVLPPMICYNVMCLLNWPSFQRKSHFTSMWLILIGCWFCVIFFVITLYTPKIYGIWRSRVDCDKR